MDWDQFTKTRNQKKKMLLQLSLNTFDEAVKLAEANSCSLQQKPAVYHFQLTCYPDRRWVRIYNLYPSTQRIYSDPKHRGPFLEVKRPWTLLDVVKARVAFQNLGKKMRENAAVKK